MTERPGPGRIDYEALAAIYARYRAASPRIVGYLLDAMAQYPTGAKVLDVGCGTADFVAALGEALVSTGSAVSGFDRSESMIEAARQKHGSAELDLCHGEAEGPWPCIDAQFDLVFSVNVIHYLRDLPAYFREAWRVLRPGGMVITVTDSEEDIAARTMTRYFAETVPHEQARYHPVARLEGVMADCGFEVMPAGHTRHETEMGPADLDRYRQRIFSGLRLITDAAFERGLAQLEANYAAEQRELVELYTYVRGVKRGAKASE